MRAWAQGTKNRTGSTNSFIYDILVIYVEDYFKWSRYRGIAECTRGEFSPEASKWCGRSSTGCIFPRFALVLILLAPIWVTMYF